VLTNVNDFLLGMEAEVVYNNSFGLATNLEAGSGETTAMTAGRIVGDALTTGQGLAEIDGGAAIMGGGAVPCATGVGCIVTAAAEPAGAAVIAHGVGLTWQATGELIENVANMASLGSGGSGGGSSSPSSRPSWVQNAGTTVNWAKNLEQGYLDNGNIPTTVDLDDLVSTARQHGVDVRLDPPHPGTPWNVPHLNIGNKGQIHVPVPQGYVLPP
jgi:hypothetical protein